MAIMKQLIAKSEMKAAKRNIENEKHEAKQWYESRRKMKA